MPVVLFAAEAKKKAKAPPPSIDKLAWLAGNWRGEKSGRVFEAQWMAPAGGVMLGMGRTVAKDREIDHEFLQIRIGPGGELFYIAAPSGQETASYQLKSMEEKAVVFENLNRDFPQRIIYTLRADGSLLAAIEGANGDGTTKHIEYPYARTQALIFP
ncbi:MAG: DUF6265 family protein [Lacunisphaera sp.]|nr:DUF6265 family protein [Lacunisphaera sp.]